MCGRFFIEETSEMSRIVEQIQHHLSIPVQMKQNGECFPGDILPVLAADRTKKPNAFAMQWGYHVHNRLLINARSETAANKPIFRDGLMQHRCIIPASWYFEWDPGKTKYAIHPHGTMTFLAGIYRMEKTPVFAVLTREPGDSTSGIHPRMPVILPRDSIRDWINPEEDPERILSRSLTEMICTPYHAEP